MESGSSTSPRVLVVDDDPDVLASLERGLRLSGFEVSTAVDGAEALRSATETRPDAIVLDINMPVLDGVSVVTALRAMDNDRSGAGLGLPVMIALVGGLLDRNTRGGTIVIGSLNLGGSVEMIPNAIAIAELAVEKQAKVLLMPVSARRALNDLPDDLWTKISIEFYKDPEDAVFKGLEE